MNAEVAETTAALTALQKLAARHHKEFLRLREQELQFATAGGLPLPNHRLTRDRWTPERLAQLPPVTDARGTVLEPNDKVRCPDGVRATIERVDRRSRRCVVARADGTKKMTVARRLVATGAAARRQSATSAA